MITIKELVINLIYKILYNIKPCYAAQLMFYLAFHKKMDLHNPKSLIEKINWLQFNTDTSLWTLCADKYRMREYVSQKGFEQNLPILFGHWEDAEQINFDLLPETFVLKSNNGCGTVKLVYSKSNLNIQATKKLMKKWLKPYGFIGGQTHYLRIKPCIIAEELLHQDGEGKSISQNSLVDYKVWCFHGKPECILVIYNRNSNNYYMDMYDINWNRIPKSLKKNAHYGVTNKKIPKPMCLEQMLNIASELAQPHIEVRVDFYIINNHPVVGELTFTSGYGNYTNEFYDYLGSKMDISHFINA